MGELDAWGTPTIRPKEFAAIRAFAQSVFGLELREGREQLVSARLGKHLRAGGFKSFDEYFRFVQSDRSGESIVSLIDALTTNHTSFLREREHFNFLTSTILPGRTSKRDFKVWSAACSSGEEPYSIVFSLAEALGPSWQGNVRVQATDISSKVLAIARQGLYSADRVASLPQGWIPKYLEKRQGGQAYQVKAPYRSAIEFRRLNLIEPFSITEQYAVIFCRNVMIYFNKATQAALVNRLASCLEPGGYLFVGHAESLTGVDQPLKYIRPAIYRKG